jgi:pilus assembly protein FimV
MPVAAAPGDAVDLDLDLDFSLGDEKPAAGADATRPVFAAERTTPLAESMPSLDMDFGAATAAFDSPAVPELNTTQSMKRPDPAAAPAPVADAGMIEFDMGALSLDLDSSPAAVPAMPAAATPEPQADEAPHSTAGSPLSTGGLEDDGGDPLATKLALAQEFNAIGDPDGARSLAQEVLAEASGDLKQKAQRFLTEIA